VIVLIGEMISSFYSIKF